MPNQYHVGDLVKVTGTFEDADGVDTDPAGTITFKVKDPSGNISTLTVGAGVTKSATGIYYADVDVDEHGTWHYRAEAGTGQGQSASEAAFLAIDSEFG